MRSEEMKDAIGPLLAEGWSIERFQEYPDASGSREIVLSIGEIGARLVDHHGSFFADIGSRDARGDWYNLKDVLRAAGEPVGAGPLMSLEEAVALLKGAASRIDAYLEDPSIASRGARSSAR
jgi:hypothetical protein